MEFLTEILAMVEQILNYVKETDAAAIVEIIKNALATILGDVAL